MTTRKMLVTGAGGMVGSYAPEVFREYGLVLTDIHGSFSFLDIRDPGAVRKAVMEIKPDFVLHLGAATDVDRCEQEPEWAYHTNAICLQRRCFPHRHTSQLYDRIGHRKGHQKAIGAVARHLAEATYWILERKQSYQEPKRTVPVSSTET